MPLEASSEQDIYRGKSKRIYIKQLFNLLATCKEINSNSHVLGTENFTKDIWPSINGTWQIRSNMELETLYNRPDIVAEIKSGRIKWLGHVLRMDSSNGYMRHNIMIFIWRWESRMCDLLYNSCDPTTQVPKREDG
jgi:hypothetical protein